MSKCRLCLVNEATKKNSHILPHSLIKSAINKDGNKYRDYELTFGLSGKEFVDTYFGQSITVDTIEEIKGRELTEEEVAKQNPFSKDYIFCPQCEKNIGVLEGYYVSEVLDKVKKEVYEKNKKDSNGNEVAYIEKVNSELVLLLVYSIFFRCSITSFHGFSLGKREEIFRKSLLEYLDDSLDKINDRINANPSGFPYLPLVNTFFKKDNDEDPTKNFVTVLHSQIPLFLYLNEITFQLYLKPKHVGKSIEYFFGMGPLLRPKEVVNKQGEIFKIVILTQDQLTKILANAFEDMASRQIAFQKKVFREVHKRIFGSKPSDELAQYYIQTLIQEEAPLGEKYSQETVAKAMFKAIKTAYQLP